MILKYLKANLNLNKVEDLNKEKSSNLFLKKIKSKLNNKNNNEKKSSIKYNAENLFEIKSVLFKEFLVEENKAILKRAFIMTLNAQFYYYDLEEWTGPFEKPLFDIKYGYYQLIKMLSNENKYYLYNNKLISVKRFLDYNSKVLLDFVPGVGFPCIFTDSSLRYSLSKNFEKDKNIYKNIPENLIEKIFDENKQSKYKPFCKIEHLKDNDLLIRVFILDLRKPIEIYRYYLYKDYHETFIKIGNDFIKEDTSFYNPKSLTFLKRINSKYIDSKILKETNAKYFIKFLIENKIENLPEKIIAILKYPFIEKVYKSGWINYGNILSDCALTTESSFKRYIKDLFAYSVSNTKEIELKQLFNLNRHQTNILKQYTNEKHFNHTIIYNLKNCLTENLSTVDNDTFNKTFQKIILLENKLSYKQNYNKSVNYNSYLYQAINILNKSFSLEKSFNIINSFISSIDSNKEYYKFFPTFNDIVNMLDEINLIKNYNLSITKERNLEIIHTDVIDIYNSIQKEYENEKFIEKLDKIKYLEYENDIFKIEIPKCCDDLVKEGTDLHHCVASYIKKIIKDETNVVFIRQKTDLEKPYFTAEVSNEKTIEQIHGFANSNVTDEKLLNFVNLWAREKNLRLNDINKAR